jgi:uncharacterized protein YjbI with pentapeptide repeats
MGTVADQKKAPAPETQSPSILAASDLREILDQHRDWLDSSGETGIQADFSRKNLEGADLIDARLQSALLNKAILRRADLMLADLRGANMLQANLEETSLLGTQFQQANLQAAVFHGATGLLSPQLAGANLFGTLLPETTSPFEGLNQVREVGRKAGWLLVLTLLLNGLVWLRIFTTPDSQLLNDSSALPFSGLQTTLPFIPFYLFGPVIILCLYVCFHLFMQRLWDGIAQLPAIFPDGRRLDACIPWFARWSARTHFRLLRNLPSPLGFLETGIAKLLLYWVGPATILLFWGRYLTLEDLRGTTLHVLLVSGAIAAAMNFPKLAGKTFGVDTLRLTNEEKSSSRKIALLHRSVPLAVGLFLFPLSIGTILGAPHDYRRTAQSPAPGIKTWSADVLWIIGYNPFAQLTEADVSTKPPGWTGREEEIALVKGASFNRLRLRYIQAYGAFLVKAHFWQTDLRDAYLAEADLREANFRQVDLQNAVLDHAKLTRATLPEADLRNANLDRADLRDANLSSAVLSGATLIDATLNGANLYKADLRLALLQRASLKQADLREANLENANFTMANLQEAYLISTKLSSAHLRNADLSQAILTDADLRKSDLSGVLLQGAVLRGADLGGASLQGADLRGAVGLTAKQVCSAANLREAQMDENLQQNIASLCGNLR